MPIHHLCGVGESELWFSCLLLIKSVLHPNQFSEIFPSKTPYLFSLLNLTCYSFDSQVIISLLNQVYFLVIAGMAPISWLVYCQLDTSYNHLGKLKNFPHQIIPWEKLSGIFGLMMDVDRSRSLGAMPPLGSCPG